MFLVNAIHQLHGLTRKLIDTQDSTKRRLAHQLEQFGAETPVSWHINLSENNFRLNTRSWNTSQLEKMLELTPIEKCVFIS